MGIKKLLVDTLGMDTVQLVFSKYRYIKTKCSTNEKIITKQKEYSVRVFEREGYHTFFGYFDVDQIDNKKEKMLVTCVEKNANTKKDKAEIGYFNIKSEKNEYVELCHTSAWCWQQGARLRWHPFKEDVILFNDVENGNYVCREFDVFNKQIINTYPCAMYDIDKEMKNGIGLDFSRLQRLRPGYGYNKLDDLTKGDSAPKGTGIYRYNFETGKSENIVSIRELAMESDKGLKYNHYVNHLSISPDGKHFIFFHVYVIEGYTSWGTRLFVADMETGQRKLLEERDNVSHYCWLNNDEVIITLSNENRKRYYAVYNINTGKKSILGKGILTRDGHPSFVADKNLIISDTYPNRRAFQELFLYDMKNNKKTTILELYSDPRLYMEKRCDLHPRVKDNLISIDTTVYDKVRKVILVSKED